MYDLGFSLTTPLYDLLRTRQTLADWLAGLNTLFGVFCTVYGFTVAIRYDRVGLVVVRLC